MAWKKNCSTLKKSHFIDERFIKFKKISSKYIQESNPLSYNTFKSLQYVMETYCNLAFSLLYFLSSDTSGCLWRGYYWDVCTQYWCSWLKSQPLYFMYKFLLMHTYEQADNGSFSQIPLWVLLTSTEETN